MQTNSLMARMIGAKGSWCGSRFASLVAGLLLAVALVMPVLAGVSALAAPATNKDRAFVEYKLYDAMNAVVATALHPRHATAANMPRRSLHGSIQTISWMPSSRNALATSRNFMRMFPRLVRAGTTLPRSIVRPSGSASRSSNPCRRPNSCGKSGCAINVEGRSFLLLRLCGPDQEIAGHWGLQHVAQLLITVWLQVRVLPGPPRSPALTPSSPSPRNTLDFPRFGAGVMARSRSLWETKAVRKRIGALRL